MTDKNHIGFSMPTIYAHFGMTSSIALPSNVCYVLKIFSKPASLFVEILFIISFENVFNICQIFVGAIRNVTPKCHSGTHPQFMCLTIKFIIYDTPSVLFI